MRADQTRNMLRYMPRCRHGEGSIRALLGRSNKRTEVRESKKTGCNDITYNRPHSGQTWEGLMVTEKVRHQWTGGPNEPGNG